MEGSVSGSDEYGAAYRVNSSTIAGREVAEAGPGSRLLELVVLSADFSEVLRFIPKEDASVLMEELTVGFGSQWLVRLE